MKKWLYCPLCKGSLRKKKTFIECVNCNWHYYINPLPSVAIFAMNEKKEILLVKRGIEPGKGKWALPSGFIESGETPEQTVLRELKEETGLNGRIRNILGAHIENTEVYGDVLLLGYYVVITGGKLRAESDAVDVKFFSKNRLPPIPFLSHRSIINQGINTTNLFSPYLEVLKSKISEAVITDTVLFYKGSMGIDAKILESANIKPGEKVQVLNYDNGERLETYVIPEPPDSKRFVLYGPASLKGKIGQRLCILSYAFVPQSEAEHFKPRILLLDKKNRIKKIK
ncbi:MAG: aspartate 1-decarboxylase [candidate division WOR-3 bacterium]